MKNLNKLGLILGVGGMSALVFSLTACGDDPPVGSGGSSGSGTGGSAAGTAGSGTSGSGGSSAGSGTSGSGGSSAGSGGMKAGGSGGGGAGGTGSGGGGAGGGGAGGTSGSGGGGAGGGGGAPSAACMKLCMGDDSIVVKCADEAGIDANLKMTPTCLQRCSMETDAAKAKCWQDHVDMSPGGDHCKHAGGAMLPCMPWPTL